MDAFGLLAGCAYGGEGLISQSVYGEYLYLKRVLSLVLLWDAFMRSAKNIANLQLLLIGRIDQKIRNFASDHHSLL
jgi:hypothetical protein